MILTQAKNIILGGSGSQDFYFSNNSLLLRLDANLSDSSSNNFSLSGYGTTNTVGISGALFGGSTSDYIEAPLDSAFNFGTGEFTIELWAYPTRTGSHTCIARWGGGNNLYFLSLETTVGVVVYIAGSGTAVITGGTIAVNQWQHIALTKQGSNLKAFLNGSQVGSTYNIGSASLSANNTNLRIGRDFITNSPFQGYIDEIRITKGVCRYSSSFSVPTRPFPDSPPIAAKKIYRGSDLVYTGGDVTDSDAVAYIAAVEAADGSSLESSTKININNFVVGCKADGIWSAIKSCCILAGARTYLGALVPLKGTAPTASLDLLNQSLYSRSVGFQGGSTAAARWIDTNRLNNADPRDNAHAAIYSSIIDAGVPLGSSNVLAGEITIRPYNGASSAFRAHDNSPVVAAATLAGFSGVSRNDPNLINYIHPSIGLTSLGVSSSNPNNAPNNIYVFRRNNDLSPSYYGGKISFYSIGTYLDLNLLKARVDALMAALTAL